MKSFQRAVAEHVRETKQQEARNSKERAAEAKAKADAIAKCYAPFKAAASNLTALMKDDSDFAKFMKGKVATFKMSGGAIYRWIASTTFGKHNEQTGWHFEMTPSYSEVDTEWHLAIDLEKNKVEIEIHCNCPSEYTSPADVPEQVWRAFQPTLSILQDNQKVYKFLLEKFGS